MGRNENLSGPPSVKVSNKSRFGKFPFDCLFWEGRLLLPVFFPDTLVFLQTVPRKTTVFIFSQFLSERLTLTGQINHAQVLISQQLRRRVTKVQICNFWSVLFFTFKQTTKYWIWLNPFGVYSTISLSLKEGFYKRQFRQCKNVMCLHFLTHRAYGIYLAEWARLTPLWSNSQIPYSWVSLSFRKLTLEIFLMGIP